MIQQVGPVLQNNTLGRAIVTVLQNLNTKVEVIDRGSYLRVLVPNECRLTREAVEKQTGSAFHLPGDLEGVMSSFRGHLKVDEDNAIWSAPNKERPHG